MNSSVPLGALKADLSSIIPCPQGMGSKPCDILTGLFFHEICFPSGTPFSFTCTSTYQHTQIQTPETYPFSFPDPLRWQYLPFSSSWSMGTAACHQFFSDLQGYLQVQGTCRPAVVVICLVAGTWARCDQLSVIPRVLYHEVCAVVSR